MGEFTLTNLVLHLPNLLPRWQPHLALHIPDGFLSLPVSLATWVVAIALIAAALNRVEAEYKEKAVPLMGVCAAFIFAAQLSQLPDSGRHIRTSAGWHTGRSAAGPLGGVAGDGGCVHGAGGSISGWRLDGAGSQCIQHGANWHLWRLLLLQSAAIDLWIQRLAGSVDRGR
jgi:hypothetical protein